MSKMSLFVMVLAAVVGFSSLSAMAAEDDAPAAAKEAAEKPAKEKKANKTKKKKGKLPAVLSHKINRLSGEEGDLGDYKGNVLVIVNVASKCGFTRQYEGLQMLHEEYSEQGLSIIGFPCNQFRNQEPGTSAEIAKFCKLKYGVEFDLYEKIDVKGDNQSDLYKYLTSKEDNPKSLGEIQWNFEKFIFNHKGKMLAHYRRNVEPDGEKMIGVIEKALAARNAKGNAKKKEKKTPKNKS